MRILTFFALLLLTPSYLYGKMPYDAVCVLNRANNGGGGSGTLVAKIDGKGLILTEAHVIPTVTQIEATWPAFKTTRIAKPVYVSYAYDTALLVIDNPPCEPVSIATAINKDEVLYSTGFPWYSRDKLHWQVGNLQKFEGFDAVITNRLAGGMSGGAVFNYRGSLAGTCKALRGKDTTSIIVTSQILIPILMAYSDPETWRPVTNHLKDKKYFKSAEREKTNLTEPYSDETAPNLQDNDPKTSNTIETKAPVKQ